MTVTKNILYQYSCQFISNVFFRCLLAWIFWDTVISALSFLATIPLEKTELIDLF